MIRGIGVDCAQVARIAKSLQSPAFMGRVFSGEEQAMLNGVKGKKREESAAACFAAKEAFLKAAGVGLGGFPLADIAALRKPGGAPYYALSGQAAQYLEENHLCAHLSLTHEAGLAMAFAVLETVEE